MVERLRKSLLYTFGVSDLFFTLMVCTELYLFSAFLTDYAQFPPKIFGQIILITSLFDIVCALVGGIILQRANLKFGGKYRSWLLIGPPIVAPLYVLQFVKIGSFSVAAVIIIVTFVASHMLFNVVYAATGSMVGRLSQVPDERTVLSSSRAQGASAASLIFSAAGLPMITYFGARTTKLAGFPITVAVFAFLMICGYWYIYRMTAGKDPYDESVASAAGPEDKQSLKDIIRAVFKNRPLLLLISADTFNNTCTFFVAAFAFYYFTYVIKNAAFLSVFILAISIALLTGTLAAPWIGLRIGKRNAYWIALALAACGYASSIFLARSAWSFTLTFCIAAGFQYVASSMNTALYSDTVIYGEWKTGKNVRAFTMALLVLPIKVGLFIRSAIITVGLIAIGYVANQDPTPEVVAGIRAIMTFAPAAACAIAAIIFSLGYKIEDKTVLQMQEEIAARKAQ
jgi:sugar (glycoside-pentoside-hexuronide) transporter